jgi:hypothetical protein
VGDSVTQREKFLCAMGLLKGLNCPTEIMDALYIWGIFVRDDETKLNNWVAVSDGSIVEGEAREILDEKYLKDDKS